VKFVKASLTVTPEPATLGDPEKDSGGRIGLGHAIVQKLRQEKKLLNRSKTNFSNISSIGNC
jgi:hypothetical protein